jgi:uncharacterized membrane protein
MRKLFAAAAAAVALSVAACNRSPEGGTPGTDQSFRLTAGPGDTHLKPGEEKLVTITVRRDDQFTEPVSLKAESQTKGVTAELAKTTAEAGDKEVSLRVKADKEATPGDYPVKVTGTPKTGKPTDLNLTVTVDKP